MLLKAGDGDEVSIPPVRDLDRKMLLKSRTKSENFSAQAKWERAEKQT
jgi:hypothetical protein